MAKRGNSETEQGPPIDVEIERLVYGGEGLARLDGQVVLVPFVLPGERAAVTTQRVKTGLLRGSGPEILVAAAERVIPRCEYFANCGGCHYQHASYDLQLRAKQEILRETLQRLGGITYEGDIGVVSGPEWNYRNRIQLHFQERKAGFHKAGSHDLCSLTHCEISSPRLNEIIASLQHAAKQPQWPEFLRSLEVFTNEEQVQLTVTDSTRPVAARFFEWCGTFIQRLASGALDYPAMGHTFRISRGSFFQVNRFLVSNLVDEVLGTSTGQSAVDLYAGVGLFSLPLSTRFESVAAVERGGPAFRDLESNAQTNARRTIEPVKAAAEDFLRGLKTPPHLIVADPPRAGLGKDATNELLRLRAPQVTLVSCDPATLTRDLRRLLDSYRIERLSMIDLFPQTYHFEVVVRLGLS